MKDLDAFIAHVKRTGRLKLLPEVLRELKREELRAKKTGERIETAQENPSLISGARTIKNGLLTDTTGKRTLLEIYKNVIS